MLHLRVLSLQRLARTKSLMHCSVSQDLSRRGPLLPRGGYANKPFSGWDMQLINLENTDIGPNALSEALKRSSQCITPTPDGLLKIAMCCYEGHDKTAVASVKEELEEVEKIVADCDARATLFSSPNASTKDISDALQSGCSVLVVAGHHSKGKGLEVSDGYLEDSRLVEMVKTSNVRMLIFTFCFAEALANALVSQVPHVHAVFSLSPELGLDDAAASFTGTVISLFTKGQDVTECFQAAVLRLTAMKDEMTVGVFKEFSTNPSHFVSLRCKAVERGKTVQERLDRIGDFLGHLSFLEKCVGETPELKAAFLESEQQYDRLGATWLPYRNTYGGVCYPTHYAPDEPFIHKGNRPDDEEWAYRCAIYQTQLCFTRLLTSERLRGDAEVHPFTMAFLNFPEGYEGIHTVQAFTPCSMSEKALIEFHKVEDESLCRSELYNEELKKLRREYGLVRNRLLELRAALLPRGD